MTHSDPLLPSAAATLSVTPPPASLCPHPGGLAGCGLNTSRPGIYTITFTVRDSRGVAAAPLNRTLVVQPSCPASERVCADGTSCSEDGICVSDLAAALGSGSGGGTSSGASSTPSGAAAAAAAALPNIQLITTASLPTTVGIVQGSPYVACSPGQQPTTGQLCELGATAAGGGSTTSSGSGGGALGTANLTARVLACPPPACVGVLCPQALFAAQGLAACGLDTSSPVGTTLQACHAGVRGEEGGTGLGLGSCLMIRPGTPLGCQGREGLG